jgi:hypothetical protein
LAWHSSQACDICRMVGTMATSRRAVALFDARCQA